MAEMVLHGVVQGHEVSKCDKMVMGACDLFYNASEGIHYDITRLHDNRKMYTLLIYGEPGRPFISYSGRAGSYFGMSIILKGQTVTNPDDLFRTLMDTYNTYVKNRIIQETPTSRKWLYPTLRDPGDTLATYVARGHSQILQEKPNLIKFQPLPIVQRTGRDY